MQTILAYLINALLDWLYKTIKNEASKAADKLAKEQERGRIDQKNVDKYAKAQDRAERVKRAGDLLNSRDT